MFQKELFLEDYINSIIIIEIPSALDHIAFFVSPLTAGYIAEMMK